MKLPLSVIVVGAIVALLVLTILGELFLPNTPATTSKPQQIADSKASPSVAPPSMVEDTEATLLARPLFEPKRRPVAGAATAHLGPATSNDLPRLAGILIVGDKKQAIFQGDAKDKPSLMGEGDLVSGYTIKTITVRGVVVVSAAGEQTLVPSFDPSAVPPEAPEAPPNPAPMPMVPQPPATAKSPMMRLFQPIPPQAVPPAQGR